MAKNLSVYATYFTGIIYKITKTLILGDPLRNKTDFGTLQRLKKDTLDYRDELISNSDDYDVHDVGIMIGRFESIAHLLGIILEETKDFKKKLMVNSKERKKKIAKDAKKLSYIG